VALVRPLGRRPARWASSIYRLGARSGAVGQPADARAHGRARARREQRTISCPTAARVWLHDFVLQAPIPDAAELDDRGAPFEDTFLHACSARRSRERRLQPPGAAAGLQARRGGGAARLCQVPASRSALRCRRPPSTGHARAPPAHRAHAGQAVPGCASTRRARRRGRRGILSFKFDSARVPGLPEPRPMFEIFVYSPRFEGVHLRGGKVARGGLRWSDRPRTSAPRCWAW
jgi:hypothetical protein